EALEAREVMSVSAHGGPVIANVQAENVFYGPAWASDPGLRGQSGQLDNFVKDLTNSAYMDMLDQYGAHRGLFTGHDVVAGGPSSGRVDDKSLQGMLAGEISRGRVPAPTGNRLYTIYTQPN